MRKRERRWLKRRSGTGKKRRGARKAEDLQGTSISKTDIILGRSLFFFFFLQRISTKNKNVIYFFNEIFWRDRDAMYKAIDVFHNVFAVFREYWI